MQFSNYFRQFPEKYSETDCKGASWLESFFLQFPANFKIKISLNWSSSVTFLYSSLTFCALHVATHWRVKKFCIKPGNEFQLTHFVGFCFWKLMKDFIRYRWAPFLLKKWNKFETTACAHCIWNLNDLKQPQSC